MPRDASSCIRAVVRVRPLLAHEVQRGEQDCCEVQDAHSMLIRAGAAGNHWRQYAFDACLPSDRSQKHVFQECGVTHLLDMAADGFAATVLAYGQTGSGKTHTMMGRLSADSAEREEARRDDGLVMRSAKRLFRKGGHDAGVAVSASFAEIFNAPGAVNECISDLLNPEAGNLQVRFSQRNGFFISDLYVVPCSSVSDVRGVLEAGLQNRRVGAHALNKDSSRSHALFTLHIESQAVAPDAPPGSAPVRRFGRITFVDLAGSERLKESLSDGNARKETQAINKSLFTLGQVISQLSQGKAERHVPYRNSKLTQLLQESFGGEALCLMVTCISPAGSFVEESINSLNYAQKAMNIRNRPVVRLDEQQQVLHELRQENAALRRELEGYKVRVGGDESTGFDGLEGAMSPGINHADAPQDNGHHPWSPRRGGGGASNRHSSREPHLSPQGSVSSRRPSRPGSPNRNGVGCSPAAARGHSAPPAEPQGIHPRPPQPTPLSAPPPQSSLGGPLSARLEAASSGSYAMAAARRRMQTEQLQQPTRKKVATMGHPGGRPLPPLPQKSQNSLESSQVGEKSNSPPPGAEVHHNAPILPIGHRSDRSSKEPSEGVKFRGETPPVAPHAPTMGPRRQSSKSLPGRPPRQEGRGDTSTSPCVPVQSQPPTSAVSQSAELFSPRQFQEPARPVQTIRALPSQRAAAKTVLGPSSSPCASTPSSSVRHEFWRRQPSDKSLTPRPQLTSAQLQRLDCSHPSEWRVEFAGQQPLPWESGARDNQGVSDRRCRGSSQASSSQSSSPSRDGASSGASSGYLTLGAPSAPRTQGLESAGTRPRHPQMNQHGLECSHVALSGLQDDSLPSLLTTDADGGKLASTEASPTAVAAVNQQSLADLHAKLSSMQLALNALRDRGADP